MTFSETIKTTRIRRGLSLQNAADAAGLTKAHVWDLETGRSHNPTIKTIFAVACALRINPDRLAHAALVDLAR
jgi:transcriptional regulator with XRE-family HTH domain